MGVSTGKILYTTVAHKRLFPRENAFRYHGYYLSLPITDDLPGPLPVNKAGVFSFHTQDHGADNQANLLKKIRGYLDSYGVDAKGEILLVTMPRVLGYAFNPISLYLCYDRNSKLKAYICEVHNTFGEQHDYICFNNDYSEITGEDWLRAQKVFHVSPFMDREGHYEFRLLYQGGKFGLWIDYFDEQGRKKLVTSLVGKAQDLTRANLWKAALRYPFITLKTILLIHYQAVKLWIKKIGYRPKPHQAEPRNTGTNRAPECKIDDRRDKDDK